MTVPRLEDLVNDLGGSNAEAGALFTELVAEILREIGFDDVFIRRGSEAGRDIDAVYRELQLFFECKRARASLETPKVAYKLQQVDLLKESLQPDYFVLVTNVGLTSQLRDLFHARQNQSAGYGVEVWSNERVQPRFDRLLLSAPEKVIAFLDAHLPTKPGNWRDLVADFRGRATNLELVPDFVAAMLTKVTSSTIGSIEPGESSFAMDYALSQSVRRSVGGELILAAGPLRPRPQVFDFDDPAATRQLTELLDRWAMRPTDRTDDAMVFREAPPPATTRIFGFGAFVLSSSLLFRDVPLHPWEWLIGAREHCLRIRNFMSSGLLETPVVLRMAIRGYRGTPFSLASLGAFVDQAAPRARRIDAQMLLSDRVQLAEPAAFHTEIGRPLVQSLWRAAGWPIPFLTEAEQVEAQWLAGARDSGQNDDYSLQQGVELIQATGWLTRGELVERPYEDFAAALRRPPA